MTPQRHRGTENRIARALAYWFWESHASWPQRVIRVYRWNEYQTANGRHTWVEQFKFWHTLWRATGMIFPACKKAWDRIEHRIWMPKEDDGFRPGM